jgi:hypothetical protein
MPELCKLAPYDPARARAELKLALQDYGGKLPNAGYPIVHVPAGFQDIATEYTKLQSE